MTQRITIDPITRLEGHGKIEIFLDDKGNVANSYFQIPELRGFERFCVGRPIEEMPLITNRICGVCPEAHNMAASKAGTWSIKWTRRARRNSCVSCCTRHFIAQTIRLTSMHWRA